MNEIVSAEQATQVMRVVMRDVMKRYWLLFVVQGILLMLLGSIGLMFPVFTTLAFIYVLGWLVVISAILQAFSLVGARHAPHFWLQLVVAVLSLIVGILLIRNPGAGVTAVSLLLIVFFFVGGIAKAVFALSIRPFPNWGWMLASGVVGVLLGVLLFSRFSEMAPWLLGFLVGIQFFCEGATITYMAWRARHPVVE